MASAKENSTKKKNVSTKSNTKNNNTKKTSTPKNTTVKKKTTSPKKTSTKKSTKTVPQKNIEKKVEAIKGLNKEEVKVDEEKNVITKQEKIEKEVIEEINSVKIAKIENAKYKTKKRDKTLLAVGVIISLLGIIALIISLIANRIIDREFINDSTITLMICCSIIIEGFGAFIIINET